MKASRNPLQACVAEAVTAYLDDTDTAMEHRMHAFMMAEVERVVLEVSYRHCGYSQSETARVLGMNRGTLRKKLLQYRLLHT